MAMMFTWVPSCGELVLPWVGACPTGTGVSSLCPRLGQSEHLQPCPCFDLTLRSESCSQAPLPPSYPKLGLLDGNLRSPVQTQPLGLKFPCHPSCPPSEEGSLFFSLPPCLLLLPSPHPVARPPSVSPARSPSFSLSSTSRLLLSLHTPLPRSAVLPFSSVLPFLMPPGLSPTLPYPKDLDRQEFTGASLSHQSTWGRGR